MNRLIYCILSSRPGVRLELQILLRQTAKAFGVDAPEIPPIAERFFNCSASCRRSEGGGVFRSAAECSAPELLRVYAQFTAEEAVRVIQNGDDLETLRQTLYQMAYNLGSHLRRWLSPKDEKECLAIVTLLYRNIGIQIEEEAPGTFCVRKCFFSDFYTPEVCSVISGIDRGIFAGIYRGGKLVFRERITEGCDVCRADFR
ncbi:MAG: hypothetical protein LUH14_03385 [Clostridiaceae bacterium]|nr:hypothetical protein [Clostridiaceae bacterium]